MTILYYPDRGLKSQPNPDWEPNPLKNYNSRKRASPNILNGRKLVAYVLRQQALSLSAHNQ